MVVGSDGWLAGGVVSEGSEIRGQWQARARFGDAGDRNPLGALSLACLLLRLSGARPGVEELTPNLWFLSLLVPSAHAASRRVAATIACAARSPLFTAP